MSLRERLNAMGIDGHTCEALIREYHQLIGSYPQARMGEFLSTVRVSMLPR